jgi:hypothetical protein
LLPGDEEEAPHAKIAKIAKDAKRAFFFALLGVLAALA